MSRRIEQIRLIVLHAVALARYRDPDPERSSEASEPLSVPLSSLNFDSLASMEFCIALELRTGLEFTPEDLQRAATLEDVVDWIMQRADAE
jgi:acyl carrier protein